MMAGTPWRMMVLVTGCTRICALSGTCLIQTTTCMGAPALRRIAGGQSTAQGVEADVATLGVLEDLEDFFLRGSRAYEVLIGSDQQLPADLQLRSRFQPGDIGLAATQILVEAFEDMQAVDTQDGGIVRNDQVLEEFLGCR